MNNFIIFFKSSFKCHFFFSRKYCWSQTTICGPVVDITKMQKKYGNKVKRSYFLRKSVVYLSRSSFDGVPWMQEQILGCQEGKWKRRSKDSRFRQYLEEGGKNILARRGGGVPWSFHWLRDIYWPSSQECSRFMEFGSLSRSLDIRDSKYLT